MSLLLIEQNIYFAYYKRNLYLSMRNVAIDSLQLTVHYCGTVADKRDGDWHFWEATVHPIQTAFFIVPRCWDSVWMEEYVGGSLVIFRHWMLLYISSVLFSHISSLGFWKDRLLHPKTQYVFVLMSGWQNTCKNKD